MPKRSGSFWTDRSGLALSVSPSDAIMMKRGFGTQIWIHRPSAHLKCPLGEREPKIQELYWGTSGFSARWYLPAVHVSAPCSSEVSTHCPRPVVSRTHSAAAIAVEAA